MKKTLQKILSVLLIISMFPAVFVGAEGAFSDVSDSAWYARAVAFAKERGTMAGVGEDRFDPNDAVTRAMFAAVLYRLDGGDMTFETPTFSDNNKGAWYFEGIEYCAAKGIVFGYGDGTFGVQDLLTREDMMTMLYRYASQHGLTSNTVEKYHTAYRDGSAVSGYAASGVDWCLQEGIVSGTSFATISPRDTASRAQLAQILLNFAEIVQKEDVRLFRQSEDNRYGIGAVSPLLYKDKFSFRLTGLKDCEALELVVRYQNGKTICAEDRVSVVKEAERYRYEGDAAALTFSGAMNAGLYQKCAVQIELFENGNQIFAHTFSLGELLQKAPDGAALYFKGERTLDCRILLYHHFVEFEPVPESYGTVSTPKRFEENLRYILDKGYSIIPMQFLIEYVLQVIFLLILLAFYQIY